LAYIYYWEYELNFILLVMKSRKKKNGDGCWFAVHDKCSCTSISYAFEILFLFYCSCNGNESADWLELPVKRHMRITIVALMLVLAVPAILYASPMAQLMGQDIVVWANNLGRKPDDPPYLTMNYRIRRMYFKISSLRTKEPIVFFGDSITFGANWQELFPQSNVVNRGISGDTTLGLLNRQDEIMALRPRQIFLMIGTNDLCFEQPPAKILANYQLILERFRKELPDTPVYVQSILPFNDNLFPSRGLRKNENIRALNNEIKKLAEKNGYDYIDLASVFTGPSGRLSQEYTYDGLHLNDNAYRIWRSQIESLVGKTRTAS
jgi:lysophospholipase L1-like esterase